MDVQPLSGIPKEKEYKLLTQSNRYREMEKFSNDFLSSNRNFLDKYAKKWVRDPLHQWSRQWEYPYVFNRIDTLINDTGVTKILDAGSGITFLPYLIKSLHPSVDIHCIDNDTNLVEIYQQINNHGKETVNFSRSDLKKLSFNREWFDIIYCISVLEHTVDYVEIIQEFYRVLRPGGQLIITFDISLDGTRDISLEQGNILLQNLAKKFAVTENISLNLMKHVKEPNLFTTHTAKKIDSSLLPWRLPHFVYRLKSFLTGKRVSTWPPLLTIFCLTLQKDLS